MTDEAGPHSELEEATITGLQAEMAAGRLSARHLVEQYLERISALDRAGPTLRSIIEVNAAALEIAEALDSERATHGPRGPLHGIPVLLKDNITTADAMRTTAGSLALAEVSYSQDAFVAARLRAAGTIFLGKANMSEWANFRSTHSSSGWSARGGQALNPYSLDRTPCGSSSGSATAVAANLVTVSLGTETDGSILCPASVNGLVGIKPTVGLTSRAGVIPIAHSQDTVGPFARTVADAAAVLTVIAGPDARDPATGQHLAAPADYAAALDPNALQGARIGVARDVYFGYNPATDALAETAIQTLRAHGATIVDPANIDTAKEMSASEAEFTVLLYEFKADLNAWLESLPANAPVRSLADLIAFNEARAAEELPYFGQEILLLAQEKGPLTEQAYVDALAENHRLSRAEGIDATLERERLDALVMPTGGPAWKIDLITGDHHAGGSAQPAALAGYPAVSVPMGHVSGLPVGLTFMGRAYSEARLIQLAYAFEQATQATQATQARHTPRYTPQTP